MRGPNNRDLLNSSTLLSSAYSEGKLRTLSRTRSPEEEGCIRRQLPHSPDQAPRQDFQRTRKELLQSTDWKQRQVREPLKGSLADAKSEGAGSRIFKPNLQNQPEEGLLAKLQKLLSMHEQKNVPGVTEQTRSIKRVTSITTTGAKPVIKSSPKKQQSKQKRMSEEESRQKTKFFEKVKKDPLDLQRTRERIQQNNRDSDQIQGFKSQVADLYTQLKRVESRCKAAQRRNLYLEETNRELEEEIRRLKAKLIQKDEIILRLQTKIDGLEEESDNLRHKLHDAQTGLVEQRARAIQYLKEHLQNFGSSVAGDYGQALKQQEALFQAQVDALKRQIDQAAQAQSQHREDQHRWRQKQLALEQTIRKLQSDIDRLQDTFYQKNHKHLIQNDMLQYLLTQAASIEGFLNQ